ncbi:MAG: polysaccharide biosynthesis protein [Lachnospiraceae bacterium]|nr:polysaccharide biosynthesis protein [Lachnospiraceae bacterium]MDD6192374.1 polysaccharide biosynthesis protein [Lachnospiraceae bacterium]MDY4793972.1 polysaccharide biosynthesis protein [Pararoseburia sp.]
MGKSKNSDTSFLLQGSILAIASFISRIVGLLYRMPLKAIIGKVGNDYYGTAFSIYNIILIISSYSIPLAVSKLVSARMGKGRVKDAYRVFKGALAFAVVSGGAGALLLYFGADFFTGTLLKTPLSAIALKILAPTLFVVAILGVFRGFFQGLNTMMPSAFSQVAEQILNAIVSIVAAYMLFSYGKNVGQMLGDPDDYAAAYGAAGGTLGTASGALLALLFMLFIYFAYRKRFLRRVKRDRHRNVESYGEIIYTLFLTILPILLSTTVYSISTIIDQGVFKNIAIVQGYSAKQISEWWGVYSGQFIVLTNVPISIASSLAASSVPSLSQAFYAGDYDKVNKQISMATRFIMVIAIPSAVGMTILGKPLNLLLFQDGDYSTMMIMLLGSLSVVLFGLSTLTNGLLQGIDKMKTPVINAVISLVIHAIVLFALMEFFDLNIYAVVIANNVYGLCVCILNDFALKRYSGARINIGKTYIIPFLSSLVMGIIVFISYEGIHKVLGSNTIAVLFSILLGMIVYFVVLLLMKGLTEEELVRFPKGNLLVCIAKKCRLLNN